MAMSKGAKIGLGIGGTVILIAVILIFIVKKKATTQIGKQPGYVPPSPGNSKGGTDYGPLLNTIAQAGLDLFKKWNNQYVQVAPIDSSGCDANGKDANGTTCTNVSSYIQVQPVDPVTGCDANNNDAVGNPCL